MRLCMNGVDLIQGVGDSWSILLHEIHHVMKVEY